MQGQARKATEQKGDIKPLTAACTSHHGKQNPLFQVEVFGDWHFFMQLQILTGKKSEFINCPTETWKEGERKKK